MAESVDALVSNTSRFTPVPVRPRLWVRRRETKVSLFFLSPEPCSFSRWRCGSVGGGCAIVASGNRYAIITA